MTLLLRTSSSWPVLHSQNSPMYPLLYHTQNLCREAKDHGIQHVGLPSRYCTLSRIQDSKSKSWWDQAQAGKLCPKKDVWWPHGSSIQFLSLCKRNPVWPCSKDLQLARIALLYHHPPPPPLIVAKISAHILKLFCVKAVMRGVSKGYTEQNLLQVMLFPWMSHNPQPRGKSGTSSAALERLKCANSRVFLQVALEPNPQITPSPRPFMFSDFYIAIPCLVEWVSGFLS